MALYCVHRGSPDRVYVFPDDVVNDGTAQVA